MAHQQDSDCSSPQNNTEQLCNACRSMTTSAKGLASLFNASGFTYNRGEVAKNAAEGCSFCELLSKVVSSPRELSQEILSCNISLEQGICEYTPAQSFEVDFWKQYSLVQKSGFYPWMGVCLTELDRRSDGLLDIYGTEGDPAATVFQMSLHSTYTSDSLLAEKMRTQLDDCLNICDSHKDCSKATTSCLPTRVIKVGTKFQNPTLYTSHLDEIGHYAALSYCWGGPQEQISTTANLEERTNGIPLEELPKTFRDAIAITRILNIQFLWIDALCILQDSEEDKISEVNGMGRLFAGATLTIAAANTNNVNGGFLKEYSRPLSCRMPFKLPDGTMGNINCVWDRDVNRQREQDPLELRGWTFQEAILSKRILYFGKEALTWRCQSIIQNLIFQKAPTEEHSVQIPSRSEVCLRIRNQETMFRANWASIVENYSARVLSFPHDRLPALAGIATDWSKAFQFEGAYMAGLWKSWLICHLGWSVTSPNDEISANRSRLRQRRSPSWSWISVGSKVKISSVNYESAVLKDCTIDLAHSASPYGDVRSGGITLQAPVLISTNPITLPPQKHGDRLLNGKELASILFRGKMVDVRMDIDVNCLEHGMPYYLFLGRTSNNWGVGLILLSSEVGDLVRVGQMMVHGDDINDIWLSSSPSQTVKIV